MTEVYTNWRDVPPHLKPKSQWRRRHRKVRPGTSPAAHMVLSHILGNDETVKPYEFLIEELDECTIVGKSRIPLYHEEDTVPYSPSPRTLAIWRYEELFLSTSRRDSFITKMDIRTGEEGGWHHSNTYLRASYISDHLANRQIIGVRSGNLTGYAVIDLDLHGKDKEVFLLQLEALLDGLRLTPKFHVRVSRNGVALHFIFNRQQPLESVIQKLRSDLQRIGNQHPDLEAAAVEAGMKPLKDLELYPTKKGNAVRLPLSRGTMMLLDRPLDLVTSRGSNVQDVEGFIQWLDGPNRILMPTADILTYVDMYVGGSKKLPKSTPKTPKPKQTSRLSLKGNLFRLVSECWIDGVGNGRNLNEHILILSTMMAVKKVRQETAVKVLKSFVRELPDGGKNMSNRLRHDKLSKVDKVIEETVRVVYEEPEDKHLSMARALDRRPHFDPTRKETWSKAGSSFVPREPLWTLDERSRLVKIFTRVLNVQGITAEDTALDFVKKIVLLTQDKLNQGRGWGHGFLMEVLRNDFPDIACKKKAKRSRIFKALVDNGIITRLASASPGRCAHWTLGVLAETAINRIPSSVMKPE